MTAACWLAGHDSHTVPVTTSPRNAGSGSLLWRTASMNFGTAAGGTVTRYTQRSFARRQIPEASSKIRHARRRQDHRGKSDLPRQGFRLRYLPLHRLAQTITPESDLPWSPGAVLLLVIQKHHRGGEGRGARQPLEEFDGCLKLPETEKRCGAFRNRRHSQGDFGDDSQGAERAGEEFAHVVTGDIFDDFAAGFDCSPRRGRLSCR